MWFGGIHPLMVSTMEPDNIGVLKAMPNISDQNFTYWCTSITKVGRSMGMFNFANPLDFTFPLLLLQMSIACAAILLTIYLIKPLGQSFMFAQILGGIIVGPSFLCRIPGLSNSIFPYRSFIVLDVVSTIGFMLYFFLIGVRTDIWVLKKLNGQNFAIGFFTVAVPMILSIAASIFLAPDVDINGKKDALFLIAAAECVISFPIVSYYLSELGIINSELGRVAICSSMVSWICGLCVVLFSAQYSISRHVVFPIFRRAGYAIALAALIMLVLGPLLVREMRQNLTQKRLKQSSVTVLLLAVVVSGLLGHVIGLNLYFGPLLIGLIIPSGPPLGSALVERLDLITNWMLMPLYVVKLGLTIDIFAFGMKSYYTVLFIALLAAFGKFLGAFLSALICQMPLMDAVSLGFVMNFQGILELGLFNIMRDVMIIDDESLSAMCTSLLILTAVLTPTVRYFGDPSRRYMGHHGRTLMNSRPNSELRILVCINDQENVPSAINLLGALNPSKPSPIGVYVLHLIELTGSSTPLLMPYKISGGLSSRIRGSGPIINAFKNFAESHGGLVSLFAFIAISPPQTMHNDVCAIALEKGTSIVIIPFYKRFNVSGATESSKMALKIANQNVLGKAPCSVAILVDRGPFKTLRALWTCWLSYEVAVIFLGGGDDREALALGIRMAGLPNIKLTLIRILYDGECSDKYMEASNLDDEVINDFRMNASGKQYAMYKEELVTGGAGTASVLRSLENQYELVVVGRRYDGVSPLLSGLTEWNDNKELGVIGDLLASSDFLGNTTILVVQQYNDCAHEEWKRIESILNASFVSRDAERAHSFGKV